MGSGFHSLEELNQLASRRTFRWPGEAREMVRAYLNTTRPELSGKVEHILQTGLKGLITRIAAVSGNPRGACWRFARQSGVTSKRSYRQWTKTEQQTLLDLIASHSLQEVTVLLCRPPTSRPAAVGRPRHVESSNRNRWSLWSAPSRFDGSAPLDCG